MSCMGTGKRLTWLNSACCHCVILLRIPGRVVQKYDYSINYETILINFENTLLTLSARSGKECQSPPTTHHIWGSKQWQKPHPDCLSLSCEAWHVNRRSDSDCNVVRATHTHTHTHTAWFNTMDITSLKWQTNDLTKTGSNQKPWNLSTIFKLTYRDKNIKNKTAKKADLFALKTQFKHHSATRTLEHCNCVYIVSAYHRR